MSLALLAPMGCKKYPFGKSHCCDQQLIIALRCYADDHGGWFPRGEKNASASLSLLYPKYADANLLRGKSVPLDTVEDILGKGGKLDATTTGWEYIEGLSAADNPRLAVFWDKHGLDHFGGIPEHPGKRVFFVSGLSEFVSDADWPTFLAEQRKLLADKQRKDFEKK